MSELSMDGVSSTMRELEAGVADAEAELARTEEFGRKLEELARTEEYCRNLTEMIAVATHEPDRRITATVISNTAEGAWPFVLLFDRELGI